MVHFHGQLQLQKKIVTVFNTMYFSKFPKFNIVINFNEDIALFSKICYTA